jgi:hypothetical protein
MLVSLRYLVTVVTCAYCGRDVRIRDLPSPWTAECFDCWLKYYRPPLLPWWKVAP